MITPDEAESIAAIALLAALADGRTAPDEREYLRTLFASLAEQHDLPGLASVHQRVVLKQTDLEREAARLSSPDAKRTAFEMAVAVVDADGSATEAEQAFLDRLEGLAGVPHDEAVAFEREAESVALADPDVETDPGPLVGPGESPGTTPTAGAQDEVSKDVDGVILKYAMLNGALELLPQNLATIAILPLQTRMVYTIGKRHGHRLGAGHIKEFIATLGIGATSQMLENFARKALGKLARRALGKTAGKITSAATGPAMTFATTYAIGKVAKAYYAGGRTLSAVDLRGLFQRDVAEGRTLYEQHRPQIEASARSIKPSAVLDLVRGRTPA